MPQVQPAQGIQPGENGAPKLYGVDKVENSVPFQERMMRRFKPAEYVMIKNIDDETLFWQYMPADKETESFSEDGVQRQIYRENPEMWEIKPGETEVIIGASAYRALDAMYKTVTAKSTLKKFSNPNSPQFNEKNEHLPKNFNYADGGQQEDFLDKAFIGKAMPVFAGQSDPQPVAAVPAPAAPQAMEVDPTVPIPKTTDGAPVKAPEYAEPDAVRDAAVNKGKELANASSAKK